MASYKYYKEKETGWDPGMARWCPGCGAKVYSSSFLESVKGSSAKCPYCGKEF
jgi:pyruvate/2-oxoacid:ferredoxin oxidoreductase beta subunit